MIPVNISIRNKNKKKMGLSCSATRLIRGKISEGKSSEYQVSQLKSS